MLESYKMTDKSKHEQNVDILKIILLERKGGVTSARIIESILVRPYNPNQIADLLDISYNTAIYHLKIMLDYNLIEKKTDKYGSCYEATENLINEIESFYKLRDLIIK